MTAATGNWREAGLLRLATLLWLLGASGLCALGRFHSALALTLGAAVAIVSALWLSDLVGRLQAPRAGTISRFDWKFGLRAVLRYAVIALAVYAAVRGLPAEVPWTLAGLSTVVLAMTLREAARTWRAVKGGGA